MIAYSAAAQNRRDRTSLIGGDELGESPHTSKITFETANPFMGINAIYTNPRDRK